MTVDRFDNISELQKHTSKDHCIAVKDKVETKTDKRDEQDKGESMKNSDIRCHKCGYILFTEDTCEQNGKQKLVCKLCPILGQTQQTYGNRLVALNRLHCTETGVRTCTTSARPK